MILGDVRPLISSIRAGTVLVAMTWGCRVDDGVVADACARVPGNHRAFTAGPCPVSVPDDPQLSCGTLALAEDPSLEQSCLLSIAWVRYEPEAPTADPPVFILGGGPGSGIVDRSEEVLALARTMAPGRVWVWHDPRSVGASTPRLDCAETTVSVDDPGLLLHDCAETYGAAGHDPARYRTETLAADVDALAAAFGAERIDVLGASYGSRLGYALASLYPERIRALVLDAATPLDAPLFERLVDSYLQAMGHIADDCAASPGCAERYGDVAAKHAANLARLRDKPMRFDALGGPVELSAPLYVALTASLASSSLVDRVPAFVSALAEGDLETAQVAVASLGSAPVDDWTHHAIQYSEELPQNDRARAQADLERLPSFSPVLPYDYQAAQCEALGMLPPPDAEPAWRGRVAPLDEALPVLALNGRYDPLSVASNWTGTNLPLPEGSLFVVPDAGHGARNSRCGAAMVRRFLEHPTNTTEMPQPECTPDPEFFLVDLEVD